MGSSRRSGTAGGASSACRGRFSAAGCCGSSARRRVLDRAARRRHTSAVSRRERPRTTRHAIGSSASLRPRLEHQLLILTAFLLRAFKRKSFASLCFQRLVSFPALCLHCLVSLHCQLLPRHSPLYAFTTSSLYAFTTSFLYASVHRFSLFVPSLCFHLSLYAVISPSLSH